MNNLYWVVDRDTLDKEQVLISNEEYPKWLNDFEIFNTENEANYYITRREEQSRKFNQIVDVYVNNIYPK